MTSFLILSLPSYVKTYDSTSLTIIWLDLSSIISAAPLTNTLTIFYSGLG